MGRAKKEKVPNIVWLSPSNEWPEQILRMFPLIMKRINPFMREMTIPDLILFAYCTGINHGIEAMEKSKGKDQ